MTQKFISGYTPSTKERVSDKELFGLQIDWNKGLRLLSKESCSLTLEECGDESERGDTK